MWIYDVKGDKGSRRRVERSMTMLKRERRERLAGGGGGMCDRERKEAYC